MPFLALVDFLAQVMTTIPRRLAADIAGPIGSVIKTIANAIPH